MAEKIDKTKIKYNIGDVVEYGKSTCTIIYTFISGGGYRYYMGTLHDNAAFGFILNKSVLISNKIEHDLHILEKYFDQRHVWIDNWSSIKIILNNHTTCPQCLKV